MLRSRYLALFGPAVTAVIFGTSLALAVPAAASSPGLAAGLAASGGARLGPAVPSAGGTNHELNGVFCPDAGFCLAVGNYDRGASVPGLSEVLSAGRWVAKPVPSPAHGSNIFANEVSCSSASNCLFVGTHWAGKNGADADLAEAWSGSAWHIVTTTGPAGVGFSVLNDVACPTQNFCLAIGDAGTTKHFQDTAYTWTNRSTWRQVTVPHPRNVVGSELGGLACADAAHCLAVGDYTPRAGQFLPFAARLDNGHWSLLTVPAVRGQLETTFQGISCPTATECVAVGNTEDNSRGRFFHAFADVWKGGTWHVSMLRKPASVLVGASCPTANRCFASGYTFPNTRSFAHQLIETWNGRTWTVEHPAQTGLGGILSHVSCVSPVSCETVGDSFSPNVKNSERAISEGWNGHRWVAQVTANP